MAEHAVGPQDYLGESDWEDDDLLSIEEAGERLRDEMVEVRSRLDDPATPAPERTRLEARMNALRECMETQRMSSWDEYLSGARTGRTERS